MNIKALLGITNFKKSRLEIDKIGAKQLVKNFVDFYMAPGDMADAHLREGIVIEIDPKKRKFTNHTFPPFDEKYKNENNLIGKDVFGKPIEVSNSTKRFGGFRPINDKIILLHRALRYLTGEIRLNITEWNLSLYFQQEDFLSDENIEKILKNKDFGLFYRLKEDNPNFITKNNKVNPKIYSLAMLNAAFSTFGYEGHYFKGIIEDGELVRYNPTDLNEQKYWVFDYDPKYLKLYNVKDLPKDAIPKNYEGNTILLDERLVNWGWYSINPPYWRLFFTGEDFLNLSDFDRSNFSKSIAESKWEAQKGQSSKKDLDIGINTKSPIFYGEPFGIFKDPRSINFLRSPKGFLNISRLGGPNDFEVNKNFIYNKYGVYPWNIFNWFLDPETKGKDIKDSLIYEEIIGYKYLQETEKYVIFTKYSQNSSTLNSLNKSIDPRIMAALNTSLTSFIQQRVQIRYEDYIKQGSPYDKDSSYVKTFETKNKIKVEPIKRQIRFDTIEVDPNLKFSLKRKEKTVSALTSTNPFFARLELLWKSIFNPNSIIESKGYYIYEVELTGLQNTQSSLNSFLQIKNKLLEVFAKNPNWQLPVYILSKEGFLIKTTLKFEKIQTLEYRNHYFTFGGVRYIWWREPIIKTEIKLVVNLSNLILYSFPIKNNQNFEIINDTSFNVINLFNSNNNYTLYFDSLFLTPPTQNNINNFQASLLSPNAWKSPFTSIGPKLIKSLLHFLWVYDVENFQFKIQNSSQIMPPFNIKKSTSIKNNPQKKYINNNIIHFIGQYKNAFSNYLEYFKQIKDLITLIKNDPQIVELLISKLSEKVRKSEKIKKAKIILTHKKAIDNAKKYISYIESNGPGSLKHFITIFNTVKKLQDLTAEKLLYFINYLPQILEKLKEIEEYRVGCDYSVIDIFKAYIDILYEWRLKYLKKRLNKVNGTLFMVASMENALNMASEVINDSSPDDLTPIAENLPIVHYLTNLTLDQKAKMTEKAIEENEYVTVVYTPVQRDPNTKEIIYPANGLYRIFSPAFSKLKKYEIPNIKMYLIFNTKNPSDLRSVKNLNHPKIIKDVMTSIDGIELQNYLLNDSLTMMEKLCAAKRLEDWWEIVLPDPVKDLKIPRLLPKYIKKDAQLVLYNESDVEKLSYIFNNEEFTPLKESPHNNPMPAAGWLGSKEVSEQLRNQTITEPPQIEDTSIFGILSKESKKKETKELTEKPNLN